MIYSSIININLFISILYYNIFILCIKNDIVFIQNNIDKPKILEYFSSMVYHNGILIVGDE